MVRRHQYAVPAEFGAGKLQLNFGDLYGSVQEEGVTTWLSGKYEPDL